MPHLSHYDDCNIERKAINDEKASTQTLAWRISLMFRFNFRRVFSFDLNLVNSVSCFVTMSIQINAKKNKTLLHLTNLL